jgi:hypothetical protein
LRQAWWDDVAVGAPSDVSVHVGPTEVRIEYAAVSRGQRVAALIGIGVTTWALTGLIMPRAAIVATLLGLLACVLTWRWLSRPTSVRLEASRLVVDDPFRGSVAVPWTEVRDVVLQEAVPDSEHSDRGIPASVRVERHRPPIGPAEPLRLGIHISARGRAWLLALVVTFWRAAGAGPGAR